MLYSLLQAAAASLMVQRCFATQFITKNSLPSDSLSGDCVNALVANVSCRSEVMAFGTGEPVPVDTLEESCTTSCRNGLGDYMASTRAACTEDDVYDISESRTAPVSFIPTLMYYYFNKTCIQDDGRWCKEVLQKMSPDNGANDTQLDMCDDCVVKAYQFQAGSPINGGWNLKSAYSSLTSSCPKTGFPLASSTLPFTRSTSTATVTPTPSCSGTTYEIQTGDTCQSISKSQSVGTAWLLKNNGLAAFCANFPSEGDLCIQDKCTTYTLKANDTCRSIALDKRVSETQLWTWNPILGSNCRHLNQSVADEICISPPGMKSWTPPSTPTTTATSSSTPSATAAPVPENIAEGTNNKCAEYYEVQKGDYCNKIVLKFGIPLEDFLFLNAGVNDNCTNLYAEESYCVAPVGSITDYPGHPGYIPPTSSVSGIPYTDLPKANYTAPPITGLPTHLPLANGTRRGCFAYADGGDLIIDLTYTFYSSVCEALVDAWGITAEQLGNWNPSLNTSSDACTPEKGVRYCMKAYSNPQTARPPSSSPTPTPTGSQSSTPTSTKLPIRDGTTKDCKKYVAVVSPMTCASVLEANDITIAQFYRWNPEVGKECKNMWLDYRYCVDGPAPSTTAGGPPAPTQSGIPDNCNKWYVAKSGDNCATVVEKFGITIEQFHKWNPAVSSDCTSGFWKEEAYCVGVAG